MRSSNLMKEESPKNSKLRRRLSRIFLWLPILVIAMGVLVFSIFQIPKIQTRLLNKVSFLVAENTGFDVKVGYANLTWFDQMIIKDLRIYDHQNDSTLIAVKELRVNVKLYDFLVNRELNADHLALDSPYLHIIKENDSTEVNVSRLITDLKELFKKNRQKKEKKTSIILDKISISNGVFTYNDLRFDSIITGKDYHHFRYDSILANLYEFSFINDSLITIIEDLSSTDHSRQLNIKHFESNFFFTKQQMRFSDMELKTDLSLIRDSLVFEYAHPSNFKYFIDSISFYMNLDQSQISAEEVALFNPSLDETHKSISFTGVLSGGLKRLKVSDFAIKTDHGTNLIGDAELLGLPKINETFINLNIKASTVNPADVAELVGDKFQQELVNIGQAKFKGRFQGFISDFVADGEVISSVGKINTDINFKILPDKKARYKGSLTLNHFDLKSIFHDQDQLRHITLNGKINGSGLRIDNADFNLDARVDSLSLNNYSYTKLSTKGEFKLGFFLGQLRAYDPNLNFESEVEIDLRDSRNKINLNATLNGVNFQPLGLSNQNLSMASVLDIDLKGLRFDDMIGYVSLYNNRIDYDGKTLEIDSIKLLSSLIGENRIIHLETDGLSAEMNGKFRNSAFIRSMKAFYNEVKLNIQNDEEDLEAYYANKSAVALEKYYLQIELNLWDVNKFARPFLPTLEISKGIKISGSFVQDSISRLNLFGSVDSLALSKTDWINNHLDINISKEFYGKSTLASAFVSSSQQFWSDKYETENTYADLLWYEDSMSLSFNIEQPNRSNQVAVQTSVLFHNDSTQFHFNKSKINLLDKKWEWDTRNRIVYKEGSWIFTDVNATNGSERLEISGSYAEDQSKSLFVDLKEFNIQNIQALLAAKVEGTIDGRVKIKRQSEQDLIEGNVIGRALKVEDFVLGNVFGVSRWNSNDNSLAINLDLVQNSKKKIEVSGLYYPKKEFDQFDLEATFDSADLKIAEPFLKKNFSQLGGLASGNFTIHGNPSNPILRGTGKISNGQVLVNYLHTKYTFNGNLIFEENEISTQNLLIQDSQHNLASLTGGVFHDAFRNAVLDFQGEFENFKLLNTTSVDNDAYYGEAYGTGNISILGAIDNIQITAEAQTAKGTRISIPLSESSDSRIEQKEYIEFVDLNDQESLIKVIEETADQEKLKVKGIELDFDLEFTTDAYVELIFDVQSGDIIRGRGNGNIELQINTDGDFTMFGDYTIDDGGYNFTLYNIINKEFDIKKGSSISWYGDPYGANLSISASYRQLASLAPLMVRFLDPDDINAPETKKKYPSIVDLTLNGNLLTPEIKFDISIQDYPQNTQLPNSSVTLDEVVTAFKARVGNNEQEMNRQVFSLIVLRKFSQENSFQVSGNTIGNSLSELISNQLSYWATQVDENLEVDVDLAGLSDDAFNTFQLRLSYTFLDGRLRVTRGSSLSNQESNGNVSNFIGDWTVEYLLTEDGRFRVKMYSRSDLEAIDQQLGENAFETGFSLQYIKSFDVLNQILSDNRKRNISERKNSVKKTTTQEEI